MSRACLAESWSPWAIIAFVLLVVSVASPALAQEPFTAPLVRVGDLKSHPVNARVRVAGVVTRRRPGTSLHIRTDSGSIRIESDSKTAVVPGDRVEAVGNVAAGAYSLYLADGDFRKTGSGPPPPPVPASVVDLVAGNHDADLISIAGTFVSLESGSDDYNITFEDEGLVFQARLMHDRAGDWPSRFRPGMRVRMAGVAAIESEGDRATHAFRVLLRDRADLAEIVTAAPRVAVSGPAPWWAWIGFVLAIAAAGAFGWAYRKNASQESTIRRQMARESSLKARFDDLFERSSEILIVHDRRGRISTLNRAGEQATGYSREEIRMLDPGWIFGTDYLDTVNQVLQEGTDSTARTFRSELVPRKGPRVPVEVQVRVLVGDGQVVGLTAIARDLSERDRLENELRQAQKMEAVGRLATGIAHDFNNLITVLLGYSDELIEGVPPDSDWGHSAREIRRAAERASGLTQQLLSFSRRQTAIPQTVDLNATLGNMEDLIRRLIGPEIRLEIVPAPGLWNIRADAAQIGQVLMNLVVNARDAMPSGGTLHIETANVELGADNIDVIPGPHVMVLVRDSGIGMSAEVVRQLFEPFFTTKEIGQGTGLGLSMVHAIVRQSTGHIMVDSSPGKGSTFRVYFPKNEAIEATVVASLAPVASSVRGEGVVLVAEDDRAVRRLVTTELARRGFTVLDAEDGRAALELFNQHKDTVDVLVTDIVMPRMNGADLAKAAEKIRPGVKILFISGHPERAGQGLDPTAATNLLMKPFTADVLAARIKELMTGQKSDAHGWGAS